MAAGTEQFAAFAARKTSEAVGAALRPLVTEINQSSASLIPIQSEWTRHLFDGDFYASPLPSSNRPSCSLVFVQSKDGNTGAKDPSALGGGDTDKHLIYEGLSRVAADGVLAGAETIRGGKIVLSVWHPELVQLRTALGKPRHPVQIVATLRGLDLEHGMLFNLPDLRIVLITIGDCTSLMRRGLDARPWITSIVMKTPDDLPTAFEQLRALGIERVSAIGGRRVATQLIDAGLVQDVYLTTAPREGGEPNTPMYPKKLNGRLIVRKRGTGDDEGVVFEHFVI